MVDWTLSNKLQWNLKRNPKLFIHENAFQNVIFENVSFFGQALPPPPPPPPPTNKYIYKDNIGEKQDTADDHRLPPWFY